MDRHCVLNLRKYYRYSIDKKRILGVTKIRSGQPCINEPPFNRMRVESGYFVPNNKDIEHNPISL